MEFNSTIVKALIKMRQHNEKSHSAISIMLALYLFRNGLLGNYMKRRVMYMELIELHNAKQAKRKQQEDFLERYRAEWGIKGERLREQRLQYRISQKFIAVQIGICESTLRKFEKGIYIRNVKMVERIYELFLGLEEERIANDRLSIQNHHLRRLLEQGNRIAIEVNGNRFDIPVVPDAQNQHRRTQRSVI